MANHLHLYICIYLHLLAFISQPKEMDMGLSGAHSLLYDFGRQNAMEGQRSHP
jgi:hypothetical protein